jgi:hypothetical protein
VNSENTLVVEPLYSCSAPLQGNKKSLNHRILLEWRKIMWAISRKNRRAAMKPTFVSEVRDSDPIPYRGKIIHHNADGSYSINDISAHFPSLAAAKLALDSASS